MSKQLSTEAYRQAVEQLGENCTDYGLLAASPASREGQQKNYTSLYSRDIGVSTQGILESGKDKLIQSVKTSLIQLAGVQSDLGMLPFYYKPEKKLVYWRSPGSIDGTIWWSIAVLQYVQHTGDKKLYAELQPHLEKAFTWLTYQDTDNNYLLEQGEASDWADEMPRAGTVLYTNALWYLLVCLRVDVEKRNDLKRLKENIYEAFNSTLWIHKQKSSALNYLPANTFIKERQSVYGNLEYINSQAVLLPYYLGYISHKSYEMRADVFGNILACDVGLADERKAEQITEFIRRSGCNLPYPVKAMYPPIYPGELDWRPYMTKSRQNYPWQYHNGAIWPFIGGFWVSWLGKYDKVYAKAELDKLAQANKLNAWEFNEYLHGQLGTPMGVPHQSWNMAMFISAYNSCK